MDWILVGLLFLHVLGAIVAFGPTFSFPLIGSMAGKEPQHVNFALRVQERISNRVIIPLAIFQAVTGALLIWRIGFDVLSRGWLLLAILLYVIALSIGLFGLRPITMKLVHLTAGPPPAPPAGSAAPSGPPPEVRALVRRAQMMGMINSVLIVSIVFLMVTNPF